MTATYDPAIAARLIAEAREDDGRMTVAPWQAIDEFIYDARRAIVETLCSDDDASGIARIRNNLRAMADQLEAAGRETDRLHRLLAAHVDQTDPSDPIGAALSGVEIDGAGHSARCPDCDLPLATQADHDATAEGEGDDLCWRAWAGDVCCRTPVDWRARALAAEARVVELEADLVRLACVDDLRTIT